jgi:hypothetical protein
MLLSHQTKENIPDSKHSTLLVADEPTAQEGRAKSAKLEGILHNLTLS